MTAEVQQAWQCKLPGGKATEDHTEIAGSSSEEHIHQGASINWSISKETGEASFFKVYCCARIYSSSELIRFQMACTLLLYLYLDIDMVTCCNWSSCQFHYDQQSLSVCYIRHLQKILLLFVSWDFRRAQLTPRLYQQWEIRVVDSKWNQMYFHLAIDSLILYCFWEVVERRAEFEKRSWLL